MIAVATYVCLHACCSYLVPPSSDICGDVEANEERDDFQHVRSNFLPAFEPIFGPFPTWVSDGSLHIGPVKAPEVVRTKPVILKHGLYRKMEGEVQNDHHQISQNDVTPPSQL